MNPKTLTYRQWQVLQAVIDEPNLSHADRARRLGIAEHTFRSHLRHAYRALGVHSLTGAVTSRAIMYHRFAPKVYQAFAAKLYHRFAPKVYQAFAPKLYH